MKHTKSRSLHTSLDFSDISYPVITKNNPLELIRNKIKAQSKDKSKREAFVKNFHKTAVMRGMPKIQLKPSRRTKSCSQEITFHENFGVSLVSLKENKPFQAKFPKDSTKKFVANVRTMRKTRLANFFSKDRLQFEKEEQILAGMHRSENNQANRILRETFNDKMFNTLVDYTLCLNSWKKREWDELDVLKSKLTVAEKMNANLREKIVRLKEQYLFDEQYSAFLNYAVNKLSTYLLDPTKDKKALKKDEKAFKKAFFKDIDKGGSMLMDYVKVLDDNIIKNIELANSRKRKVRYIAEINHKRTKEEENTNKNQEEGLFSLVKCLKEEKVKQESMQKYKDELSSLLRTESYRSGNKFYLSSERILAETLEVIETVVDEEEVDKIKRVRMLKGFRRAEFIKQSFKLVGEYLRIFEEKVTELGKKHPVQVKLEWKEIEKEKKKNNIANRKRDEKAARERVLREIEKNQNKIVIKKKNLKGWSVPQGTLGNKESNSVKTTDNNYMDYTEKEMEFVVTSKV